MDDRLSRTKQSWDRDEESDDSDTNELLPPAATFDESEKQVDVSAM